MRRIVYICFMVAVSAGCFAQNASENAKIAEIRKMYDSEMEWINIMLGDETIPDDYITAKVRHNLAGTGQAEETIEFFFNDDFDEEVGKDVSYLDFVRKTTVYIIAEGKSYEEFLYDDAGLPAFYYTFFTTYMEDGGHYVEKCVEIRAYYDKGVQFHTICKVGNDKSSLKEAPLTEELENQLFFGFLQFGKLKDALNGMLN
ncbi:MAG: hypothetical protein IK025_10705 [Bacteroidales bacterium]|nr:hypothetical protein [Bacteroidales bacterium]